MLRSVAAIGLALMACESAPQSRPETPEPDPVAAVSHPRAQADVAAQLQLAVSQGRLGDAHDLAAWFTTHEMTDHIGWRPYLDELRGAAQNIARANDLATAGVELGRLGHACGGCHQAAGVTVAVDDTTPPEDTSTLVAQMRRQQWAAARLWEGLSGPADRAWSEGANVMVATPFDIGSQMKDKPNVEAFELAERLQDQATHAVALRDLDARANHYGELMQTCAGCHRILRPLPVVNTGSPLVGSR